MTFRQLVSQLYGLSVGGWFNGVKFTKAELAEYIRNMFRITDGGVRLLNNRLVMRIAMPDGEWFFWIKKRGSAWEYWIPETREQESREDWFSGEVL